MKILRLKRSGFPSRLLHYKLALWTFFSSFPFSFTLTTSYKDANFHLSYLLQIQIGLRDIAFSNICFITHQPWQPSFPALLSFTSNTNYRAANFPLPYLLKIQIELRYMAFSNTCFITYQLFLLSFFTYYTNSMIPKSNTMIQGDSASLVYFPSPPQQDHDRFLSPSMYTKRTEYFTMANCRKNIYIAVNTGQGYELLGVHTLP